MLRKIFNCLALFLLQTHLISAAAETSLKEVFNALIEHRIKEGADKLSTVDDHSAEKIAVRLFAAFSMSSWEEVIQLYPQLPEPYRSLDGYRGMVILSYIYLDKITQAENLLNQLLQSTEEPKTEKLPEYFRDFKEKTLDKFNRYYIAALFNKIVKKDLSKALEFLNQIKRPSAEMQIELADIYLRQGKYAEALRLLVDLWKLPVPSAVDKEIHSRILPQLGSICVQLGDYIAAVKYFREYFSLHPENMDHRLDYANALMEIRRFDLAVNQFELYAAHTPLASGDKVDYIRSLVGAGKLEKVSQLGTTWVEEGKMPLLSQIRLARLLFIVQNQKLADKILTTAAAQVKRSFDENLALIQLYMDLGNFQEAATLISLLKRDLEQTVPGLLLIADFYTRISDPRSGYNYALRANQLDPLDPKAAKMLESYEQTPSEVARNVKGLETMLQRDGENDQLRLLYAKDLMILGIEAYSSGQLKSLIVSPDLQKAKALLEDLLRKNPDIPEFYFLQGKIAYLMDDNRAALEAFQRAIQLCPSYADAYQYLALIEEDRHHLDDALTALKSAVMFEPWNAKAWLQLGNLSVSADRSLEAIQAFEMARKYAPYSPEPLVDLAALYLHLNRIGEAIGLLKSALDLDPREISAVKLMLEALYNKNYEHAVKDLEELKKMRLLYFDKLEALDPKTAETLRRQFSSTQ